MNFKTKLSLFLVLAIGLFSCTMVKSPQSADFHRVKYNPHLKFAKKADKEKLPETVSSFAKEESEKIASKDEKHIEPMDRTVSYNSLTASVQAASAAPKTTEQKELKAEVEVVETKSKSKTEPIFNPYAEAMERSNISSYLNSPAPVASDAALGDILYIILVVLLILIVISLIADLAGGLIGALIAVLLILLILRLLGYV
ncbi:MAG: hypothetical protein WD530_07765 [Vicingaceae bacterium]